MYLAERYTEHGLSVIQEVELLQKQEGTKLSDLHFRTKGASLFGGRQTDGLSKYITKSFDEHLFCTYKCQNIIEEVIFKLRPEGRVGIRQETKA